MKTAIRTFHYAIFLLAAALMCIAPTALSAQTGNLTLSGQVLDSTGAVVPGAVVTVVTGNSNLSATSGADGHYQFRDLSVGAYKLTATAAGFATFTQELTLTATRQLNISLTVATEQQVNVTTETNGVSVSNDENVNSTVLKGDDLNALSEDPDMLRNELMALAGPAAGPDGGQIYIDGFTGGQLPPKSSILEIRVNQNPYSAENDRIGYGRVDILTKPGAPKISGHLRFSYLNSALNTAYPLVSQQPSYQYYAIGPDITGPIGKNASYFAPFQYWERQNQDMVDAVDPSNQNNTIRQAFPAYYSTLQTAPRIDFQKGKHVVSLQDIVYRTHQDGKGVGGLLLPEQAVVGYDLTNMLVARDTIIVSPHLLNEVAVRWWRDRSNRVPASVRPAVSVVGAFTSGGSTAGYATDHLDLFEFHNYATISAGQHNMRAGVLLRSYRDAYYQPANINGSYTFQSFADYQAGKPSLYSATIVHNPTARILAFDGAVFFQDEWRVRPNLSLGSGLRIEGQNRIHNPLNLEPRVALTWAPHNDGHAAPKTALHAAFGIFATRFNFGLQERTIVNNGFAQQTYVVTNPTFYDPNHAIAENVLTSSGTSHPTINTLAPNFHAALYLQSGAGVDRTLGKQSTLNVSYLFTQGTHQYLSNNISAPLFNASNYTVSGTAPTTLNYQYQSGGIFKEHQIIATARTRYKVLSLQGTYTYSHAAGDTQGAGYFPTDGRNPGLDYGRASFSLTHQIQAMGSWTLPRGVTLTGMLYAQSGTPYNITLGNDLAQNNQFNSRPTYGTCGATDVVKTAFGCLDTNPAGKGEKIVPYNLGTGPANHVVILVLTKTVGFGPRIVPPAGSIAPTPTAGAAATPAPQRYSLNIQLGATNVFNVANRAAPNGVLSSPLFGQSQGLAGGAYSLSSPGNRTVYVTTVLSF